MPWYKRKPVDYLPFPPDLELALNGHVTTAMPPSTFQHNVNSHANPEDVARSAQYTGHSAPFTSNSHHPPTATPPATASSNVNRRDLQLEQLDSMNHALHSQIEVWQIRTTGEIFTNYDDYIARYGFLRKKQFSCAKTGKSNLTYEEALTSEQQATKRVEETFPEVWRVPAMQLIHYSMEKLNALTEELYEHFASHLFLREHIYINVGGVLAMAQILEAIPPMSSENDGTQPPIDSEGPFPIIDSEILYRVNLVDNEHNLLTVQDLDGAFPVEYIYPVSQLKRDRQILAKQNFKKFIRDVATREVWIGAPWIVRPEFVKKYRVPDTPPPAVLQVLEDRHRKLTGEPKPTPKKEKEKEKSDTSPNSNGRKAKSSKGPETIGPKRKGRPPKLSAPPSTASPAKTKSKPKPKPKPLKFPMDDLELLEVAPPQFDASLGPVPAAPDFSHDFGPISSFVVKDLLQVVNFLCVYGKPLKLFPFTLDEFVDALAHNGVDSPAPLLSEAFGCLLHVICQDYGNKFDDVDTPPVHQETSQATAGQWSEYSPETQAAMAEYIQLYTALTDDERAAIDQWWKWEPGRAGRTSDGKRSAGGKHAPDAGRLKAWEIVLAGVIRDLAEISTLPNKWIMLVHLLRKGDLLEAEMTPIKDKEPEDDLAIMDSNSIDTSESSPMDTLDIDHEDDRPFGLRKRRKINHNAEDSVYRGDESTNSRSRRAQSRSLGRQAAMAPATKSRTSTPTLSHKKKKSKAKIAFDQLIETTEWGFTWRISCDDRVNLLAFLVRQQVGSSNLIRTFIDESLEKATELRKEKREIAKERKEVAAVKAEIFKAEREEEEQLARANGESPNRNDVTPNAGETGDEREQHANKSDEMDQSPGSQSQEEGDEEDEGSVSSADSASSSGSTSASSASSSRSSKAEVGRGDNSDSGSDDENDVTAEIDVVGEETPAVSESDDEEDEEKVDVDDAKVEERDSEADGSDMEQPRPRRRTTRPAYTTVTSTTSRVQKLQAARLAQSHQEALERAEIEASQAVAKQAKKIARERALFRKTTDAKLDALMSRDKDIDEHITTCLAASRIKPLGVDRFYNRYWYFDPAVQPPPLSSAATPVTSAHVEPPPPTHARLYIEQTGLDPISPPSSPSKAALGSVLTAAERDVIIQGLTDGVWAYIKDPTQLDDLLQSLDRRGYRELHLAEVLEKTVKGRWIEGPRERERAYVNWWA
ncbi:hypothetical protein DFJ77DRAFT_457418 [Powellomyces hirtus]|nr:hypothetical protein DFJ77DRAFT_457418 [Powellomyces hirtus]